MVANESYGYGDSGKGSPGVTLSSSEVGYTLRRLYRVTMGVQ